MSLLVAALTVGVGIHLVVALFLLLRYLDGRERLFGWWALAYGFFAAHVFIEALLAAGAAPAWYALRHVTFIVAAWAMIYSFRPLWWSTAVAGSIALLAALLLPRSWLAAALTASAAGGAGFIASAWLLYRQEGGLLGQSARLLFWGLLLTGLHALDYPFLRTHPELAPVGAAFSGIFTLAFGVGIIQQAWQRTRELITMRTVAETLNRSLDTRGALGEALQQIVAMMRVECGWIFLRNGGEFQVAAAEHLPASLAASDMAAMQGDCRCLQLLRDGALTQAVNIVHCQRLERAGWAQPRHATVPLRTAGGGLIGVLNLVLPARRTLTPRELATLSAIGDQIGLAAERARLYEELREKEALRGKLLEKLITAQEDERRRIARELHDEAGQALTALILNLEMAEQAGAQGVAPERLARLRAIAEDTLAELRRLIYDLRPTILDDLGLAAAVRWYVKETVEPQGLHVSMSISGGDDRLPHHIETAVFRIVQEALTNILKHAQASRAAIEIAITPQEVRLAISDDGRGFSLAQVTTRREGGMGLLGMRERAELLGGAVRFTSWEGGGTRVEAVIPVQAENDGQD
ncbi:MAG TPA: GAF domain-containing sensor histidine kinase [bacterium]|nr:GAF domain-containing sensor histidine kinase [bacterium]